MRSGGGRVDDEPGESGFTVNVVAIEGLPGGLDGILVALARDPRSNDNVLILSRAFHPTAQDRRLGMATYCLSVGSGATAYAGVLSSSISGNVLSLVLSRETADKLGVPEECHFPLNVDAETMARLVTALRTVFAVDDGGRPRLRL
jgi:hypothetical protein